jgi:hypothetical protein
LNTRLFKSADGKEYELMIASAESSTERMPYLKSYEFKDIKINVTAGDFPVFMQELVNGLEAAK